MPTLLSRHDRERRTTDLVEELRRDLHPDDRRACQDRLAEVNLGVADSIAARFRNRGISQDDLQQVAALGLVLAVRRFDPHAGSDFLAFCVPTVRGEVRRHFRDRGWTVRPPRRVQELQPLIAAARPELHARTGAVATAAEIAAHLGHPVDQVQEAMAVQGAFAPASLDQPVGEDGSATLGDLLSTGGAGQSAAEARLVLSPALRGMAERDRRILLLRFVRGCTQQEIADDIGVTQMQVSRLLTRIYADLRAHLGEPDAAVMIA